MPRSPQAITAADIYFLPEFQPIDDPLTTQTITRQSEDIPGLPTPTDRYNNIPSAFVFRPSMEHGQLRSCPSNVTRNPELSALPTRVESVQDGHDVQYPGLGCLSGLDISEANGQDVATDHNPVRNPLFEWGQITRSSPSEPRRDANYLLTNSWPQSHESIPSTHRILSVPLSNNSFYSFPQNLNAHLNPSLKADTPVVRIDPSTAMYACSSSQAESASYATQHPPAISFVHAMNSLSAADSPTNDNASATVSQSSGDIESSL